MIKLTCLFI